MVSAQVAKFLLTKDGKPLTPEECQQIVKILRLAVDKGMLILTSGKIAVI